MSVGRLRAMSGSSNGSYQDNMRKTVVGSRTVPCRHWMLKGHCDLKDDCKFAHGDRDSLAGGQFKTKLCRIFLQSGSCPNGFGCNFAHGDSDLRSVWPGAGRGALRFPGDNMKTVMCKNWIELGTCSFGDKCTFAHSEEQIRTGKEQKMIFQNPLYKTTLCKQYNEGDFCELGDNCHFAHGPDELRMLRPLEKSDPATDPSFKTVLCKNWEETEGSCEYGESCRFAHGAEELRMVKTSEAPAVVVNKNVSPQYKTVLCSNHLDCKFGSGCNFAHSELELRTVQQNLAEINPNYKGTLCKYHMTTGQCEFGSICQYAHGESELRRNVVSQQSSVTGKQNYNNSFLGEATFNSPQFKTILCKNYEDSGKCDFASRCQFAHGKTELRTVPQNYLQHQPVQKASSVKELCKLWLQTGHCRRPLCPAAHCLNELSSQQSCRNLRERGYCTLGTSCQSCHSPSSRSQQSAVTPSPRPVKVVLCQSYSQAALCDRGQTCTFAHGLEELHHHRARQVPNYRTTLCQAWSAAGQCKYGETCMYAHGHLQLRNKAVLGPGLDIFSSPSGVPDCKRIKY